MGKDHSQTLNITGWGLCPVATLPLPLKELSMAWMHNVLRFGMSGLMITTGCDAYQARQ